MTTEELNDIIQEVRELSIADSELADNYEWEPAGQPEPPPDYYPLAAFLCERYGLPVGTFSDAEGICRALTGHKPWYVWHPQVKLSVPAAPPAPKKVLRKSKPTKPAKQSATKKYSDESRSKEVPRGRKAA